MILKLADEISKFNNAFENFKTEHASLVNEHIEYLKDYLNFMEYRNCKFCPNLHEENKKINYNKLLKLL